MASSDQSVITSAIAEVAATAGDVLAARRRRRRWLAIALAIPAVALPAVLIIDAAADVVPWGRILALSAIAGATGWCALVALRRRDPLDLLAVGEAALGEADRRFTAATQLAASTDPRAQAHAAALAGLVPSDASDLVSAGLFPARAWQPLAWGAAAVAVFAVVAWAFPNLLPACLPRLMDPFGDHPPYSATRLTWSDPPTESRFNEPIDLTVAVSGPVPQDLLLHACVSGTTEVLPGESHLLPAGDGRWRVRLESPTDSLRLWVSGAGTRTRWLDLPLDGIPRLRAASAELTAPSYANLPVTRVRCLTPSDSTLPILDALDGSSVRLDLACSRPPTAVWLVGPNGTILPTTLIEPPVMKGRDAVVAIAIADPQPGTWSVSLAAADGARSTPRPLLSITRRIDQPPAARIAMPDDGALATPGATLPLHVFATDDLGLAQLTIYRLIGDKQVSEGRHILGGTGDTWRGNVTLDGVKPGDRVRIGAVVRDTCPPAGQVSSPAEVTLTIIALDTYLTLAREQLSEQALVQRFEPVFAKLAALEEESRRLADEKPSPARDQKIAELAQKIADTRRELAEQAKLEIFATDGEVFKAVDERLAELEQGAKDRFPQGSGTDQAKKLGDELDHLTAQAQADAVQDWIKDLAVAQRRMATEFSDLAQNQVPSDMQRARMRELARQQAELEEALHELAAEGEGISLRLAASDAAQAEHLHDVAAALKTTTTPAKAAANQAIRGKAQSASEQAGIAATALEKLVSQRRDGTCKNGTCTGKSLSQCRNQLAAMAKRGMGMGGSPHSSGGGAALGSFGGGTYARRGGDAHPNQGKQIYGPASTLAAASDRRGGKGLDGKGGQVPEAGTGTAEPTPYARGERATTAGIGASLTPAEEHLVDEYFRGLNDATPQAPAPAPAEK